MAAAVALKSAFTTYIDKSQTAAAPPAAELAGHARRRRPPASFSCVSIQEAKQYWIL